MQRVIRRDSVAFCREVLRFNPWSKQQEILESVRDHKRTAVRSAHGVGKTAMAARCALWFLAAHPYSRVVTTAPTWSQVKEQLWREIHVAHMRADGFFDGQLDDTRLELAPDWFAIGLSTDRPERFSGHHARDLLLVIDEASGVSEEIFEAAETFDQRWREGADDRKPDGEQRHRPRRLPSRSGGLELHLDQRSRQSCFQRRAGLGRGSSPAGVAPVG